MDNDPLVILVDETDTPLGQMGKEEAHLKGLLHRAFSVFIFNNNGELLLQKRASGKYHSPGLWTNTCCSHPYPEEDTLAAAKRRLREEMGMVCELKKIFDFIYYVQLDKGMTEHEFDHVFVGYSDDLPKLNKQEVDDFKYESIENVLKGIQLSPNSYTEWFKIAIIRIANFINNPQ